MDTHDDRRDETLAFVWEFWFRVRGHAVEVLLLCSCGIAPDGLAGWRVLPVATHVEVG